MPKLDNKGCRSCRHYDVERAKNKAGAILSSRAARCFWKPAVPVEVPDSIRGMDRKHVERLNKGQMFGYMEPNDGKNCPMYERRA